MNSYLFTSESVSEGHPDKLADQISDAVLDSYFAFDPNARVACECLLTGKTVMVAGEVKSKTDFKINVDDLVKKVILGAGYNDESLGFPIDTLEVICRLQAQAAEIGYAVDRADGNLGAGDQGMMFGYATKESPELMPLGISLAHKLMLRHSELRKAGAISWLRPDAKSQVTIKYMDGKPLGVDTVVLSTQHDANITHDKLFKAIKHELIDEVIPVELRLNHMNYIINPSGSFVLGGPMADTGLTGRKVAVDSYGASCPVGGGAFSGKDPTKVDRSGAYMARYVAKNIVAAGFAERCTLQISYAIGTIKPISLFIDLHGTGRIDECRLLKAVNEIFDLSPGGIIKTLDLRRPIYKGTAAHGHFGREEEAFTWEKCDKVKELQAYCKKL